MHGGRWAIWPSRVRAATRRCHLRAVVASRGHIIRARGVALSPGARLGPYEVTVLLGAGGMGEVYKATDTRLDRVVAIKVLPSQVAGDPHFRARFEREARTLGSLHHAHICPIHDVGSADGVDYLVMEYLDGETLADRLRSGRLPLAAALTIAIEIADALDTAHRAGVVHRDLKPANIMLTKDGAKLLDFGIARVGSAVSTGLSMLPTAPPNLTIQGTVLGTIPTWRPSRLKVAKRMRAATSSRSVPCSLR